MEVALARGRKGFWQENVDDKPARTGGRVGERNLPAMRERNVAGDGPSPVPPVSQLREDSSLWNGPKACSKDSGGIPGPSSRH